MDSKVLYDAQTFTNRYKKMFNLKQAIEIGLTMNDARNQDLADAAGMSQAALSNLKSRGNPTLTTLNLLAGSFGVNLSQFIKWGEYGK